MMRYPTLREKEMEQLEIQFNDFVIYNDKYRDLTNAHLSEDAPAEIKSAFTKWQKLWKEQKEEDDQWPFVH